MTKLDEQLDQENKIEHDDLKLIKEVFQKHEVTIFSASETTVIIERDFLFISVGTNASFN